MEQSQIDSTTMRNQRLISVMCRIQPNFKAVFDFDPAFYSKKHIQEINAIPEFTERLLLHTNSKTATPRAQPPDLGK